MNLKDFVKEALIEIDAGVTEAGKESHRDMFFAYGNSNKRTVEFDIAVTVEQNKAASGKSGLKVLQFIEAGADVSKEIKNSTVSRISFGVEIDMSTKKENQKMLDSDFL